MKLTKTFLLRFFTLATLTFFPTLIFHYEGSCSSESGCNARLSVLGGKFNNPFSIVPAEPKIKSVKIKHIIAEVKGDKITGGSHSLKDLLASFTDRAELRKYSSSIFQRNANDFKRIEVQCLKKDKSNKSKFSKLMDKVNNRNFNCSGQNSYCEQAFCDLHKTYISETDPATGVIKYWMPRSRFDREAANAIVGAAKKNKDMVKEGWFYGKSAFPDGMSKDEIEEAAKKAVKDCLRGKPIGAVRSSFTVMSESDLKEHCGKIVTSSYNNKTFKVGFSVKKQRETCSDILDCLEIDTFFPLWTQ